MRLTRVPIGLPPKEYVTEVKVGTYKCLTLKLIMKTSNNFQC